MRKSRFFQRDAYIAVDFLEKSAEIVRMEDAKEPIDPLAITIDLGAKGTKLILFDKPKVEAINSIGEELRSFLESINENTPTAVTIEEGYDALSVAYQIMDKMKIGLPAGN